VSDERDEREETETRGDVSEDADPKRAVEPEESRAEERADSRDEDEHSTSARSVDHEVEKSEPDADGTDSEDDEATGTDDDATGTDDEAPISESDSDSESESESESESDSDSDSASESESAPASESESESGSESASASESGSESESGTRSALEPASRRSRQVGAAVFLVGLLLTFLLMANTEQLAHGTLYGLAALLVAVFGLFGLVGMIRRDPDARLLRDTAFDALEGEPVWMAPRITVPTAAVLLLGGALVGGYTLLPYVIGAALLTLLASAIRRPGMLVFVIVAGIYVPLCGTFSLWDPWETHYGEVAREIVSRDDWISLWWAQENWFWSKPIAIFWSEAFFLSALDVDVSPDANPLHPEWAIRLPVVLISLAAVMCVYGTLKRIFGTRAGVFGALALASMPHFFFLSHQAITDMYLVANLTMATCMLILAFATDPEERSKTIRVGRLDLGWHHALVGGLVTLALPQSLYLISRNVDFFPTEGFRLHPDQFLFGSAGNSNVPGNATLRDQLPHFDAPWDQPAVQGLVWLVGLAVLVWLLRKERRLQALCMYAFYVFCALAFMGKGIPGIALPGMVALLYLIASRRWSVLFSGQLRIAPGILTVAVVGLPWYVAMFYRHGPAFTDRLLVHDHINRLAAGVHGDTGTVQYFLWQLGYATFPWVALIPAAVLGWLWQSRSQQLDARARNQRETMMLVGIWFFGSFALFSAMITKFHHYIFPAVPPAAMMVGILLDRLWGPSAKTTRERVATVVAIVAPVVLAVGIGALWGDLRGYVPEDVPQAEVQDWVLRNGPSSVLAYVMIFAAGAAFAYAARLLYRPEGRSAEGLSLGVAVGAGAVLLAFVGRDLSWVTSGRPQGYERLIHLFVYNYGRPWPEEWDYRPILTGFAIAGSLIVLLASLRWARAAAARGLLGLALAFSAWTLNVYMIDLSEHWGMKGLFAAYYEHREGPEEPVIAWQMNWKGENFYTGNRVHAFVDLDNEKVREWIEENRGKTAFFVFEHSRLGSFRNLVRGREIEEITDKRDCNKFMVVRVPEL